MNGYAASLVSHGPYLPNDKKTSVLEICCAKHTARHPKIAVFHKVILQNWCRFFIFDKFSVTDAFHPCVK